MLVNSISGYTFTQTEYQYERLKRVFPWLYASLIIVPFALVAIGIELNFAGHRWWNLPLSFIPGIALGFVLLRPQFYPWLLGLGVLDKLSDRVPNTPREVILGGLDLFQILLKLVAHVSLITQTVLMLLAIHRFENYGVAYVAVAGLTGMMIAVALFVQFTGKVYGTIMLCFWIPLFVGALILAMFFADYFRDETSYLVRHAQGEVEAQYREKRRDILLPKAKAGTLTLDDREELQFLDDQERAVKSVTQSAVPYSFKIQDGLGQQEIKLPITPGGYTCKAELTAKNPKDLQVTIDGIGVDLATTVYVNKRPCNGQAEINFGPDGKAIRHFNLDSDAKAKVRGVSRWIKITFTPA